MPSPGRDSQLKEVQKAECSPESPRAQGQKSVNLVYSYLCQSYEINTTTLHVASGSLVWLVIILFI